MKPKRYRIKDGILRFEDKINTFEDYINVPEGVYSIDFNEVRHIKKPLNLSKTAIREIDFKNVITVDNVYLPPNCMITEHLYYAEKIIAPEGTVIISERLQELDVYNNKPLIYLSGTVGGKLALRHTQRTKLLRAGYAVYSPGNHITFGDPIADKYPEIVADIDFAMLERCSIIIFDLETLSPGTSAELGWAIGAGYFKTKKLYYFNKDTKNFFINGLTKLMQPIESIEQFVKEHKLCN